MSTANKTVSNKPFSIADKLDNDLWLQRFDIAVVIPAYNVEREIGAVLTSLPDFLAHIIVVNDASRDKTGEIVRELAKSDSRIILVEHEKNRGVGGAMVTGFQEALATDARIIVKLDGDGQMNPAGIAALALPLINGKADYTKGNRFRDFRALSQMPPLRRAGNMALSFMTKAATGYWSCFDPTNGFFAIRREILAQLPLEKIHSSYFFEISMLSQLYLLGALVNDIPMPAKYGDERSNLSIPRVLREFPFKLLFCLLRRLVLKNFIYDFTMESVYLMLGVPMMLAGLIHGFYNWIFYYHIRVGAPTGTIMIPTLLVILGFQILLAAINIDLQAVPREPLCAQPLTDEKSANPDL